MAEMNLDDFIEVDEQELATGISIDTSQLDDDADDPNKKKPTETEDENLIDVDDEEITSKTTGTEESTTVEEEEEEEEEENTFKAFTNLLKEKGVFPNIEEAEFEKVEDADAIVALLNKQLGVVNNTWKDNYTQHLVNNLIRDGVIKPNQVSNPASQKFTAEEITGNADNAKTTLESFYRSKGIPEAQIQTIVDTVLDVEEEALKVLPLIEEEERAKNAAITQRLKAQEEAQLNQQTTFNEKLVTTVNAYEEFIPGRKLTDDDKKDVVGRIPIVLDKINKDLGKYAPILAFLDKYEFLDGKMDKLINEVETKKTDAFSKIMQSKKRGTSNNPKSKGGGLSGSGVPQIYK